MYNIILYYYSGVIAVQKPEINSRGTPTSILYCVVSVNV